MNVRCPYEGNSLDAIGRRLRLTRHTLGLSQKNFCERVGIAPNTYNQHEMGARRLSIKNAISLAESYALTLDWIFKGRMSGLRYDLGTNLEALKTARASSDKNTA